MGRMAVVKPDGVVVSENVGFIWTTPVPEGMPGLFPYEVGGIFKSESNVCQKGHGMVRLVQDAVKLTLQASMTML